MIELKELKSNEELPNISLSDVMENPFSEYLNLCFALILDAIAKRTGRQDTLFDDMSKDEEYVKKEHDIQNSIQSSLECIDYAIRFINSYGENDYLRSDYISFDKFSAYHYDVICHKVSTVKDLFFKLTNQTYNLGLGNKECKWKPIDEKKDIINNSSLFDIFNANKELNSDIANKRNASTHDGSLKIPSLCNIKWYLWASNANETLSKFVPKDPKYERDSREYSVQINLAKNEVLYECNIIRYNIFAVTKSFFSCLFEKLRANIKQSFPNIDDRATELLSLKE